MPSPTGNKNHDATVVAATSTFQAAVNVAGVTQAQATAAAVAYYRSVLASAVSNNLDQGPFIFALQSLRATP
jgi:hypothetical protein